MFKKAFFIMLCLYVSASVHAQQQSARSLSVSAIDLYKEYKADWNAANEGIKTFDFDDKYEKYTSIEIRGVVQGFYKAETNTYRLVNLYGIQNSKDINALVGLVPKDENDQLVSPLKPGQQIVAHCTSMASTIYPILKGCTFN
jgi:hypothetical protein